MGKKDFWDDGWNREHEFMQKQRKLLYRKMHEYIRQQQGEMVYILSCSEKYSNEYTQIQKKLDDFRLHKNNPDTITSLHQRITRLNSVQDSIISVLQPLFNELYTKIADDTEGGLGYNEELRTDVWLDMIFGERDISGSMDGSRNNYRSEYIAKLPELYQKKIKPIEKKARIPRDHIRITDENYEEMSRIITQNMERIIQEYSQKFKFDSKNSSIYKQFIEKYFLYIFIRALIDTKGVFDMKSTKGGACLDGTIEEIIIHFEQDIHQKLHLDRKNIRAKLRVNTNNQEIEPMDLSYHNTNFEDMEKWEEYLNQTYFLPRKISINSLRAQIMEEYNNQKGIHEKYVEMLNPWYHIYKEQEEQYKKDLDIITAYQKDLPDANVSQSFYIDIIIKDINERIFFASEEKKKYTIFEDKQKKIVPKYEKSLTEIQRKYLIMYNVPVQYQQIFCVVFNKLNHYYQVKISLLKQADKINHQTFNNLANSDQTGSDFYYAFQNYRTYEHINKTFAEKRSKTQSDRFVELQQMFKKIQPLFRKKDAEDSSQLGLEFYK